MNSDEIQQLIAGFVLWMRENHATGVNPSDVLVFQEPAEYNGKGYYFLWYPFKSEGRTKNDYGLDRRYTMCTVSPNVIFEMGADGQLYDTNRTIGDHYRYSGSKWGRSVIYTVPAGWWIITVPNLVEWRSSLKSAIEKLLSWMNL